MDVLATRSAMGTNPAPITNRYDHNRDGRVNVSDYAIVRSNTDANPLILMSARPLPPTGLTADAVSTTRIDLDWDDSGPGSVTYNVYRGSDSDFIPDPATNRIASGIPVSMYSDVTAAPSVRCYYVVTASAALESAPSDVATDFTGFNEQPSGLTSETVDESAIELYWSDDSSNELGYTVDMFDGSQWVLVQELPADSTFAFVDGLFSEATNTFRVTANYPTGPAPFVILQENPPTVAAGTAAQGERHSLVLLIHGHKHKAGANPIGSGISDLRQRLRAQNYRVITATEWWQAPPSVNWDGTGSLLNLALGRLRGNLGIEHVGVVGYSHGAAISRRVIQRLSNERDPLQDFWNVTYSAYIDAIERGPFDDWPLVVAETRRPVFQGTVNH